MPVEDAQSILRAEYRKPIQRGDLENVDPGSVVAMIDGVFEQTLAVSVREIHEAVLRGVVIFGGASMGALRAAEVPGVIGVGRVFEWYRYGVIDRDDEVALLFSESSGRPLTVPSVNVRFAVDRLCRLGTIDPSTGEALVAAALKIPYKERTYRTILEAAGLSGRADGGDLILMLQAHDIKNRDAQVVLEAVDRYLQTCGDSSMGTVSALPRTRDAHSSALMEAPGTQLSLRSDELLIWESGDRVSHEDLVAFLAYTGQLERRAAKLARVPHRDTACTISPADAQSAFRSAVRRWGWMSSEETRVTLSDLGLDLELVDIGCRSQIEGTVQAATFIRNAPEEFRRALLVDLFFDGLALKREAMRLGSLRHLANHAENEPEPEELLEAEAVLSKVNGEFSLCATRRRWAALGFDDEAKHDEFVRLLARARRVARRMVRAIKRGNAPPVALQVKTFAFACAPCPKPRGESRFSLPLAEAEEHARRIGQIIGVTRVGMIGELGALSGIQVAQAARPGNAWSSSYGSGKSRSAAGAVAGSIMEETEKWAQEQFRPGENALTGTYRDLQNRGDILDPATLDLPYDTVYHPDMQLEWYPCWDLLGGRPIHVPVDVLDMRRRKHDICFTARGARKHLATNGLGSGFRREEAILHGLCEYVERHAQRMAEMLLSNPGGIGPHPYRFVDLNTAAAPVQDVVRRLTSRTATVRVLDITSEIRIPSFFATVMRDLQRADGFGTHSDPNVAIEMAILEAAQTIAGSTAAGREDLSIHARSLGRHERPRALNVADAWFWMDPDCVQKSVSEVAGLTSTDIYSDLTWCLERLCAAGVDHALVVDLTPPGIEPASVVRVILPGLETNNPFYTGLRARLLLLNDLLPRWQ